MRVDVIFDTICPWCYVGKRRLEAACLLRPNIKV
ncbi:MAG: DsbA family protein, partial [Alphaproteobacteria bacterium]|nr:DsbA family protein [Alphaproteobacteria bacterium]